MTRVGTRRSRNGAALVVLLLRAAWRRSQGRIRRAQQLREQRQRRPGRRGILGAFVTASVALFALMAHGIAAFLLVLTVQAGQRMDLEAEGRFVVSAATYQALEQVLRLPGSHEERVAEIREHEVRHETRSLGRDARHARAAAMIEAAEQRGMEAFRQHASLGITGLAEHGTAAIAGSFVLLFWFLMLVCQGEGIDLDLTRPRHPMWEWLLSHPVPPWVVFTSDMLAPIASNLTYLTAPVLPGSLFAVIYGPWVGLAAAVCLGIPISLAAAFLGKACEISVLLRCPPRTRGAILGLMSWFGYASMILLCAGMGAAADITAGIAWAAHACGDLPCPILAPLLGEFATYRSWPLGIVFGASIAMLIGGTAVAMNVWGARRGITGVSAHSTPVVPASAAQRFGRLPLVRKELLWFARDRAAVVQCLLIPVSLAGMQLVNMRSALHLAFGSWNALCGLAILFGTYVVWILGPRSLAAEGASLWMPLTWPGGLEGLLRTKAWLWTVLSTILVLPGLVLAIIWYRSAWWAILLVGVGWLAFSASLSLKAVSLVAATSESGEPQPIPRGRRWAVSLGLLTFALGILTRQWQLAVVGVVYGFVTAAAVWEQFRARLPYLWDPWSERMPRPPTLLHALVGISILVDVVAIITSIVVGAGARDAVVTVRALAYTIVGAVVALGLQWFLAGRRVGVGQILRWQGVRSRLPRVVWVGFALGAGVLLSLVADGYLHLVARAAPHVVPAAAPMSVRSVLAELGLSVVVAPLAEEYLFRGLLFRSLDRSWGTWPAILGSGLFFAMYHPPLAWVPVATLGMLNAWLFRRSGWLIPAMVCHAAYNLGIALL